MRIELQAPIALAMLLAGCASTSIRDDLDDVRELTRAIALADVSEDVETEPDEDALELLGAPLDADGAVRIAVTVAQTNRALDVLQRGPDCQWRITRSLNYPVKPAV